MSPDPGGLGIARALVVLLALFGTWGAAFAAPPAAPPGGEADDDPKAAGKGGSRASAKSADKAAARDADKAAARDADKAVVGDADKPAGGGSDKSAIDRVIKDGARGGEGGGEGGANKKERFPELVRPKGPPSLTLESIDAGTGRAVVRVGGSAKGLPFRMFVLHDERERHYIATASRCVPASALTFGSSTPDEPDKEASVASVAAAPVAEGPKDRAGKPEKSSAKDAGKAARDLPEDDLRCELEFPRHYLARARVLRMTVRLKERDVAADDAEVQAKFDAARARAPHGSARPPADDPGFLRSRGPRADETADQEEEGGGAQ